MAGLLNPFAAELAAFRSSQSEVLQSHLILTFKGLESSAAHTLQVSSTGVGPVETGVLPFLPPNDVAFVLLRRHFVQETISASSSSVVAPTSTKFVCLFWFPSSGVPIKRKMNLTSNEGSIKTLLRPYHTDMNCTEEAEVNERDVMKRVSDAAGTSNKTEGLSQKDLVAGRGSSNTAWTPKKKDKNDDEQDGGSKDKDKDKVADDGQTRERGTGSRASNSYSPGAFRGMSKIPLIADPAEARRPSGGSFEGGEEETTQETERPRTASWARPASNSVSGSSSYTPGAFQGISKVSAGVAAMGVGGVGTASSSSSSSSPAKKFVPGTSSAPQSLALDPLDGGSALKSAVSRVRSDKPEDKDIDFCVAEFDCSSSSTPFLKLKAVGGGGVDMALGHLASDKFNYLLIRVTEVIDRTTATKFCFVKSLPDATPIKHKGKLGTLTGAVQAEFGAAHGDLTITEAAELTLEAVQLKTKKR